MSLSIKLFVCLEGASEAAGGGQCDTDTDAEAVGDGQQQEQIELNKARDEKLF